MLATGICLLLGVFLLAHLARRPSFGQNAPKNPGIRQYPILGAVDFFTRKTAFFRELRTKSDTGNFSFYVGKKLVVGVTAPSSRAAFFQTKELAFGEAAAEFYSGIPEIKNLEAKNSIFGILIRNLTKLLRPENLSKNMRNLTADAQNACRAFSQEKPKTDNWRVIDPHEHLYRLVFQMTMRTVGIRDFADDPVLMDRSLHLLERFEQSESVSRIIFPWFPTITHVKRMRTALQFYLMVSRAVINRKKADTTESDALQMLIDQGDDTTQIVSFLMPALFAGLVNTGLQAAWILLYLATNPDWKDRVLHEVDASITKHRTIPGQTASEILESLKLEDWEAEFPLIGLCLRESIRLQMPGISLRKNLGDDDVSLNNHGEVIPKGAFAAYLFDSVHNDPAIYADPEKWDPSRYLPDRAEDSKHPHSYLGWGSGRHPCTGQRFAVLEITIIVAFFVSQFQYELADESGNATTRIIEPIGHETHISKKPGPPFHIRLRERVRT